MNQLDFFILLIVLVFTSYGAYKGLINQLFGLASILVAYLGVRYFGQKFQVLIANYFEDIWLLSMFAYVLLFVFIVLIIKLIGKVMTTASSFAALGGMNRLLGALFGALNGLIILLASYQIYVFFLARFNSIQFAAFSTSTLAPMLEKISRLILSFIV